MPTGRILIVEDDEMLNDIYRIGFREKLPDINLDVVRTVDEANAARAKNVPNLVILDLLLPGHSGFALLKELHDEGLTKTIPVLVATNFYEVKLINKALELGARDYIVKSRVVTDDLVERCKKMLESAS